MNKIIPIWKDKGITSYDLIRKIKKNVKGVKIGHCGTLDPFAEGMMLICTGNKTKEVQEIMEYDKIYETKILLGKETDTLDLTGSVIRQNIIQKFDFDLLNNIIEKFNGTVYQSPPYFSAVKINGVRLYKLARKDIYIRKRPREVKINNIKLLNLNDNCIDVRLSVGKGFYIRAFAKDLASKLGTYGHLLELKRTAIGPFDKNNTVSIGDIKFA